MAGDDAVVRYLLMSISLMLDTLVGEPGEQKDHLAVYFMARMGFRIPYCIHSTHGVGR